MQSDGPYHIRNGPFDSYKRIEGPTVVYSRLGEIDYALDALNDAHAAGRKSIEKDFQELLELTNCMAKMLKEIWAVYVPSRDPSFLVGFTAWKKTRGIE